MSTESDSSASSSPGGQWNQNANSGTHIAASFQVATPEPFTFSRPEEWVKWIRRFERFRVASGLAQRDEEVQVSTLIYAMGDQADDILRSFALSEEDRKNYATVKSRFDNHFVLGNHPLLSDCTVMYCDVISITYYDVMYSVLELSV